VAVTLATAARLFSLMVSSGRRDPRNGFALEEPSICSVENFSSEGEGRALAVIGHSGGNEKSLANPHAPRGCTNSVGEKNSPICRKIE
jgi:hypothetical protein